MKRRQFEIQYRGKILYIIANVLLWLIIICMPFIMATRDGTLTSLNKYVIYMWIPIMFMLLFYLNYYYLVDEFIFKRQRWTWFLACNVVLIFCISIGSHIWQEFYLTNLVKGAGDPTPRVSLIMFIIRDGIVLLLTVALSVAMKMVNAWSENERNRIKLETEKSNAELQSLRSQLNPHFLFNTLNNIYSLVGIDAERAQYAIHDLSKILRYVLYENRQNFVPMRQEIDFTRSYIDLMKLRLSSNVNLTVHLPDDTDEMMIAPLMFMTLVENAFKHGVSQSEPSFIDIDIAVRRSDRDTKVICRVTNSDFPKHDEDRSGSGIGIENLRRRLDLLYPHRHSYTSRRQDKQYSTELSITI